MAMHLPWGFIFGIIGNIISFMVLLSPLPTFYRIFKKKSAQGFQSIPYVAALFSCMLWIYYASLKSNAMLLITINSVGCVIETFYIVMYIAYASKKDRMTTLKILLLLNFTTFLLISLLTYYLAKGSNRIRVMGWICLVFNVCVFAAPLSIMSKVIRTKSVEFMPFSLSLFLTLNAVVWFFYGLLQKDFYIYLPNILGFALGILQMVLYLIYKYYMKVPEEQEMSTRAKQDAAAAAATHDIQYPYSPCPTPTAAKKEIKICMAQPTTVFGEQILNQV